MFQEIHFAPRVQKILVPDELIACNVNLGLKGV